jgi:ADP-ribose pyrophosphatase
MKVDIHARKQIIDGFFQVEEVKLQHELFAGGMSEELTRLNLERGEAAAAILYHKEQNKYLFIRQFRYSTLARSGGWLTEIVAGKIDAGETPETTAGREIKEETGLIPGELTKISEFYVSPGTTSEYIHLYLASVTGEVERSRNETVPDPEEDILVIGLNIEEITTALQSGILQDAKTIIACQYILMSERSQILKVV